MELFWLLKTKETSLYNGLTQKISQKNEHWYLKYIKLLLPDHSLPDNVIRLSTKYINIECGKGICLLL